MKTFYLFCFQFLFIYFVQAELELTKLRQEVLDLEKLSIVPKTYPAEGKTGDGIKAIYYDGLDYKGKSTKVFAYLGFPQSPIATPLPAMVLVHGGGGTAFFDWVKEWTSRGYVAISIATEGQTDVRIKEKKWWVQHEWAGPKRQGIYQDDKEDLKDQWMYHAVADVILARNLLGSLKEVDSEKIGLMGISWGGIITSTVMGIDRKFAFVIPTYGCGDLHKIANHYRILNDQDMYKQVWNPMIRMERATMPALWLSWTGDTHFPLDVQSTNYFKAPGPRMVSYIPNMKHSHQAGWRPGDSYAFADSLIKNQKLWAQQKNLKINGLSFELNFFSDKKADKASLFSTVDTGHTAKRDWVEKELYFKQAGKEISITGDIPNGTTAWFVNLSCGELTLSSDFQNRQN